MVRAQDADAIGEDTFEQGGGLLDPAGVPVGIGKGVERGQGCGVSVSE